MTSEPARLPTPTLLRRVVAATSAATSVVALAGTGVAVGDAVAPWAGWAVVLVVSGVVTWRVGSQVLDDRANLAMVEKRPAPEPPPRPGGNPGTTAMMPSHGQH